MRLKKCLIISVLCLVHSVINPSVEANQSIIQEQVTGIENEVGTLKMNMFATSCETENSNETGAYYIRPIGTTEKPFLVLCDFEDHYSLGRGWIVFQNRFDGSVDFYRNWTMYKDGFGDVNGEHWLGLEKLHAMTRSGKHELLILLEDFEGNSEYAHYVDFKIGSEEEKYKLTVGKYSGTAGDALQVHKGMKFTTYDQYNDNSNTPYNNCAEVFSGAWWFTGCYMSHLNGRYYKKGAQFKEEGVHWNLFRIRYSLKSTKMMFRSRT